MTLNEIAKLANVSASTVSRILNSKDNSFASEEVRNRVWDVIKSTGYVPNAAARNLRLKSNARDTKANNSIACIFAREKKTIENPFSPQVARGIEQQALAMGYVMAYTFTAFDVENIVYGGRAMAESVDGMAIIGKFDDVIVDFFRSHTKNIVYVGLNRMDFDCDQVLCDGYDVGLCGMNYLIGQGHKRIAYLGITENDVRYDAYLQAQKAAGILVDSRLIINCVPNSDGGYNGTKTLLENNPSPPDAIFCINDIIAIAAIKHLRDVGLKVPNDVSVIGIDNIEMAQYISPMLTTVNIPKTEMGVTAAKILIDRIEKGHKLPMKVLLPHELVVRESVVRLGNR